MATTKPSQKEVGKKVTIALAAGKAAVWFERLVKEKEIHLCRIVGQITDYKADSGDYGEFVKFKGMFRGINMVSGKMEEINAPVALFPSNVSDMLKSAVDSLRAEGLSAFKVDVGFDIYAVYNVDMATKYSYKSVSLITAPADQDPMTELLMRAEGVAPLQLTNSAENTDMPASAVNEIKKSETAQTSKKR
jgi:hypothetical protein